MNLLHIRKQSPAFHPNGEQGVLKLEKEIFAVLRSVSQEKNHILCLNNVTNQEIAITIPLRKIAIPLRKIGFKLPSGMT